MSRPEARWPLARRDALLRRGAEARHLPARARPRGREARRAPREWRRREPVPGWLAAPAVALPWLGRRRWRCETAPGQARAAPGRAPPRLAGGTARAGSAAEDRPGSPSVRSAGWSVLP